MKAYFINILMFVGIFACYEFGIFEVFTTNGMHAAVFILVCVLFVLGFFVFGNPFGERGDNDEKK